MFSPSRFSSGMTSFGCRSSPTCSHTPRRSWAALLKALLGNPHPAYVATSSGRGILLRLLLGETLDLLLRDDDLILALALAAPNGGGGESS